MFGAIAFTEPKYALVASKGNGSVEGKILLYWGKKYNNFGIRYYEQIINIIFRDSIQKHDNLTCQSITFRAYLH